MEVELYTTNSAVLAAVPSGASTGSYEACELRDGSKEYGGKGVNKALNSVKKIFPTIKSLPVSDQRKIDETMLKLDGTPNKKILGANAILGVSMAVARAGAAEHKTRLYKYISAVYGLKKGKMPLPMANVINGGKHAGNDLKFQEFMIVPVGAKSFSEATRIVSEIYHKLGEIISAGFGAQATAVGDEGGFAPPISRPEEALDLLEVATKAAGYAGKVSFAIDAAASEFYNQKAQLYDLGFAILNRVQLAEYYETLCREYKIFSIEDPFHEDDYEGFKLLMKGIGGKVRIVGDDLTVTNTKRIRAAADMNLCNMLLLKINQIGTITEALEAAHLAQSKGWGVIVSHRSGETEDSFIADLAVGLGCGYIKLGAPCRGERTAKYNQLLRISEEF